MTFSTGYSTLSHGIGVYVFEALGLRVYLLIF